MRILLVTGIFPPDHGGPASYVPMIASELKARNHEIVAIVTLSDLVDGNGYDFPVIRLRRAMWRPLRIVKTIWTIMRHSRRAVSDGRIVEVSRTTYRHDRFTVYLQLSDR